jgi:hypothetical protein
MLCIAALGTPCLPSRRRWQQLLLLSGLVWGLVIISPDFARVFSPLSRFGMTIDNDGLVLAVDASWPSPSATICYAEHEMPGLDRWGHRAPSHGRRRSIVISNSLVS